ncbi:MAG TPA: cyclomaltodextrinase N-terminal domain-containing protein, partial [Balneolaceae bacterium]|nr:cyclomaltodextrinase N-terminal domain-containing protein [Balneolaceae bacterium]
MKLMRVFCSALLFTFIFSFSANAQNYKLKRVEPLHWWTNMHNPELQIMMYGQDIGDLTPEINYKGVDTQRVERVGNNNYLFIYLKISEKAEAGNFDISLLKNGQEKIVYSYELKERESGSAMRQGFNNSDVIYLITPDRFANGNYENDEIKGYADKHNRQDDFGRHGGDIRGIINHLDYIEEMGFTAIWLNPVLENEMPEGSYHGYATTDYYKVD